MLFARLRDADPATAVRVDPRNGRRIVRALEVLAQGEGTHGAALPEEPVPWRARSSRAHESARRARRATGRARRAHVGGRPPGRGRSSCRHEVSSGWHRTPRDRLRAGAGAAVRDETQSEAIAETQALTRRYARRQVSWFRRYPGVVWSTRGTSMSTRPDTGSHDIDPRVRPERHRVRHRPLAGRRPDAVVEQPAPRHPAQAHRPARAVPRRRRRPTRSSAP